MQPILKIDLSQQQIEEFIIPKDWEKDFIGGASLAARILYDSLTADLDPLSPEAPLLFLTGPLTGTSGPAVGRFVVCGKSPATGLWAESNCGGFWGVELRKTGYDGLLITGQAKEPTYLWLKDGELQFSDAGHLWGLDTYDIQTQIQAELDEKKAKVAGIGIAGEQRISSALILVDHGRVAGRTGLGAVMGSKNLKAIAVRGTSQIPVADIDKYKEVRTLANKALNKDNLTKIVREMGSAASAEYFDYLGEMPKKYFSEGEFDGAWKIGGSQISETILTRYAPCHSCLIACGRVVKLGNGHGEQKGPEYETLVGFGPNLLIDDVAFITKMGDLCDRYGMDVITVSNTIGLAFMLFEKGIINIEDTNGRNLEWGDQQVVEDLVHAYAHLEGFGALLAKGAQALGAHYNASDEAIHVNGLEIAYHDPRGASGMALVYATSPRGGCHNQSDYFLPEIGKNEENLGIVPFDRQGGAEKADNVIRHQDYRTMANAMVICFFGSLDPQIYVDLLNASLGSSLNIQDYLKIGERAWNLKRGINNRLGLKRQNDTLPKPLLKALPSGGAQGFEIDLHEMLKAYYQARSWDWDTGFPTLEKLENLGLTFLAQDLWFEEPKG